MRTFNLAGHTIEFSDCQEIGMGGPEACLMSIDGRPLSGRHFHPTPLVFEGDVLVPLWEAARFYVARITPNTLGVRKLSRGFGYMRLLHVESGEVAFSTWWDDRETHSIRLVPR